MDTKKPAPAQSAAFQAAFDHFNKELFSDELRPCMLAWSRDSKVKGGYFAAEKWRDEDGEPLHEIAVNANLMAEGDLPLLYRVMVHEMVHQWQFDHGKRPSRSGYHNAQCLNKMRDMGLPPLDAKSGEPIPEGKGGFAVDNAVDDDGPFMSALLTLPEEAVFPFDSDVLMDKEQEGKGNGEKKRQNSGGAKHKYVCPVCGNACWARPNAEFNCGADGEPLVEQTKGSD